MVGQAAQASETENVWDGKRLGGGEGVLLLFITAGMVVKRKPCVRGGKE